MCVLTGIMAQVFANDPEVGYSYSKSKVRQNYHDLINSTLINSDEVHLN